jgi:glutaminase
MTVSDPVSRALDELHGRLAGETGGALADYIPELANVDPGRFGISLCSP